ncbi:AraC family transcriptional regulator [uncultured Fluviicola sp.]|uniref:helix-turn-helix domain-containing protein n=1 Tax=uncultured Fluviicola sp. TaxID=463303 RepID=UPI0025F9DA5C|nr:helix-turn-helix transcriptional regulator [uncultured Fluviicola sp.]
MKKQVYVFNSISDFHKIAGLPAPEHPLVSVIDYGLVEYQTDDKEISWLQHFYCIGLKHDMNGRFRYGHQQYDFDGGIVSMVSPGQLVQITIDKTPPKPSGIILCLHPDFLWNHPMAKKIKQYDFFGYSVNEALFVSEKEEEVVVDILQKMKQEYHSNIDAFTQGIIIAHLEVLLNYFDRFYQRQFITRQKTNHQVLEKLEDLLESYFRSGDLIEKGLPQAQDIASQLNISPNYLSSLLKSLTGQTTQQHIHSKLIEAAKVKLSTTQLSVSEIAFELGFEHSQSFNRLFKSKTGVTPMEYRSWN